VKPEDLTFVGKSNLFTMGIVGKKDPRRHLPDSYEIPTEECRLFRAKILAEEFFETLTAMGVQMRVNGVMAQVPVANDGHNVAFKPMPCQTCGGKGESLFLGDPATGLKTYTKCLTCNGDGKQPPNLIGMIDGNCDIIYVATGNMLQCGAPDMPHLQEVCWANDSKFPGGVAFTDSTTGKFLKPEGWQPPNHQRIIDRSKK